MIARATIVVTILLVPALANAACKGRSSGSRQPGRAPVVIEIPAEEGRAASCPSRPRSDCEAGRASRLVLRDLPRFDDDRFLWRWNGAGAFGDAELGDPDVATTFGVCVYDSHDRAPFLIASLRVETGRRWRKDRSGGWRYAASRNGPAGITAVRLKNGAAGRAVVRIEAEGQRLPLPRPASRSRFFHQDEEVLVQFVSSNSGKCWGSLFTSARTNSADAFTASAPARQPGATAGDP